MRSLERGVMNGIWALICVAQFLLAYWLLRATLDADQALAAGVSVVWALAEYPGHKEKA